MGAVHATINLTNRDDMARAKDGTIPPSAVRRRSVECLADSGATTLVIPQSLATSLGLDRLGKRLVVIADGSVSECDVVGPIEVAFQDRSMVGSAIAMPGEVQILLGQIQMEDMDLVIDPLAQKLIPNPASPERARMMAVGFTLRGPA